MTRSTESRMVVSWLVTLALAAAIEAINFPGVSESAASRLVFGRQTSYSTAACTADGVALSTIGEV